MRVAFETLGCRLNQFETQAMAQRLRDRLPGTTIVGWGDAADVYVVNSCAVTQRAEQKCRQLARGAKRREPDAKVMVVGCYPQLGAEKLGAVAEIDAVLGTAEKHRLDEYLPRLHRGPLVAVSKLRRGLPIADEWIEDFGQQSRPTVKVQEGCDLRCSFCAIWKARGPSRSREPRAVVEQALQLSRVGYQEIVLAGVHLGHYGRDLATPTSLHELLDMLLELLPGQVRIRLSSIDPGEVDDAMVERLAGDPRLCRYLHLPLQSGSDSVLARMRRAYDRRTYEQLVGRAFAADSAFGLGIDLITGFPGESEAEFEEGLELLERLPVAFYHVFRYSDRPGTAAAALPGKVPVESAQRRSAILRDLGARKRRDFLRGLVGREFDAILEGDPIDGRSEWMLDNYATVRCAPGPHRRGETARLRLDGLDERGDLSGRLVATGEPEGGVAHA